LTLADRPQSASSSLGLSVPSAHARFEGPLVAGGQPCSVPPSGFGYPLDGFLPSNPVRFCFTPAALLGFAPSKHHLPTGIQTFPPERTHLPFRLRLFPTPKRRTGPHRLRFLGFVPVEGSEQKTMGLAPLPSEAPLGFTLLGHAVKTLIRLSPDLLSRTLSTQPQVTQPTGAPESRSIFT
jgi:hypothetical protein